VLASSVYHTPRIGPQQASGLLTLSNTSANTYSYAVGAYHVSNPATAATYSNTTALTIPPLNSHIGGAIATASNTTPVVLTTTSPHGIATGAVVFVAGVSGNTGALGFFPVIVLSSTSFALNGSVGQGAGTGGFVFPTIQTAIAADVAGVVGAAGVGEIQQIITANTGVSATNLTLLFGAPFEGNVALAARCRLKLASLSPNGARDAYRYIALTSAALLAALSPPVVLTVGSIAKAVSFGNAQLGSVTTVVAASSGAVPGATNLTVVGATNATPIQVTVAGPHGLVDGNFATVEGVLGNTNANGTFQITRVDATNFTLNGSVGNGAYVAGGVVEAGDLGEVDRVLQANAVPDTVTAFTLSAQNFNVAISASVQVLQSYVQSYQIAVQTALAVYFAALPIGGLGAGTKLGILSYDVVLGILYAAGILSSGTESVVQNITSLTLNGVSGDLQFSSVIAVAVLSPAPVILVTGV
jgi:hypothetical protein